EPLESGEPEAISLESVAPGTRPLEPIPLPPVENGGGKNRLTLEPAETLAIGFHPAMREAAAQVRALQGNWVQVGLRPNPTIGYAGDEMGAKRTDGKTGRTI